jgi:hypothetical protein
MSPLGVCSPFGDLRSWENVLNKECVMRDDEKNFEVYLSFYEDDRYYDIMVLVDEAKKLLQGLTENTDIDSIREIATILEEAENV